MHNSTNLRCIITLATKTPGSQSYILANTNTVTRIAYAIDEAWICNNVHAIANTAVPKPL